MFAGACCRIEKADSVLCGDDQFVFVGHDVAYNVRGQCGRVARFHPVNGKAVGAQVEFVQASQVCADPHNLLCPVVIDCLDVVVRDTVPAFFMAVPAISIVFPVVDVHATAFGADP